MGESGCHRSGTGRERVWRNLPVAAAALATVGVLSTASHADAATRSRATTRTTRPPVASLATVPPSPVVRAGESVSIELVRRLFLPDTIGADGVRAAVDLVIGRVPGGFPDVPVPTGTTVVGGITGSAFSPSIAFFDAPGNASETLELMQRDLVAAGWRSLGGPPSGLGGFTPSPIAAPVFASWCRPEVMLSAQIEGTVPGPGSRLRLTAMRSNPPYVMTPCSTGAGPVSTFPPSISMLPTLRAANGEPLTSTGFSGGNGWVASTAELRSRRAPEQVLDTFGAQLAAAGWVRLTTSATDQVGATVWRLPVDGTASTTTTTIAGSPSTPRTGHLTVTVLTEDRRFLFLRADNGAVAAPLSFGGAPPTTILVAPPSAAVAVPSPTTVAVPSPTTAAVPAPAN